jgi:predicted unusual protein kinase regulating ubiquinone biosynthesis (AarF/ABC1/UbiB family)
MGRKRDKLTSITTSWAGRTLASGKVALSLGKGLAARAGAPIHEAQLGEQLADQLDGMKGLAMKVGQMVSYLDGTLPPAAQKALQRLQQGAEPLPFDAIRPVLEAAFGAPLPELFDEFEPEPIAAASIGQVHVARYLGEKVAVTVQYPGVRETLALDVNTFRRAGRLATLGTSVDILEMAEELAERLDEECDYPREGAVQQLMGRLYEGDPSIVVPRVVPERTAAMVLTQGFAEGRGFYDFVEHADPEARNRAGAHLFRLAFRNIFHHGLLHGDPHPGNLLFPDDRGDRVVQLDYGCVRFFDPTFVDTWKTLAHCILEQRRDRLVEATMATGFVPDPDRYDWDAHWDVMNYLYEPFLTPHFHYTRAYVERSFELIGLQSPNWRRTAMPGPWLLTNRLQWGLNSLLALLGAEGDFGTLYRSCLELPLVPTLPPEPLPTPEP